MASAVLTDKLAAVSDLIRLPKQYGTALLLGPTLWSLFIASGGSPSAKHLIIFTVGAFLMRSAGCAINDIADRDFDRHVERTRKRPLADGRLTVPEALTVFLLLIALSFALVLFLNRLTIILSVGGVLFAATYPLVKRVSFFPQAYLGMAFGWGAVMAWSAVTGEVGAAGLLIFTANIFWSTAYDTIYAMMDIEDDRRIGVKSTAIFFGKHVFKAVYALYGAFGVTLLALGYEAGLGAVYYGGLALTFVFFITMVRGLEVRGLEKKKGQGEAALRVFIANAAGGGLILASIIGDRWL